MRRWRQAVLILCLLFLATGAGCGPTQKTVGLDAALADYHAGRYASCRTAANGLIATATAGERDEARYLAGLSAYRLGDLREAERHLSMASSAPDRTLAANAKASLGLVRMDQQRPREAATLFEEASHGLSGDDATRAMQYASIAHHHAGDESSARTWATLARKAAAANPLSSTPSRSAGSFSLQVGAFRERGRAEQAAAAAGANARRIGYGGPRIVARTETNGATLWLVQLGSFTTRGEAARARDRLGAQEYIVVPTAPRGS
jgi:tetratricopeptide (TPR) repeat protein